MFHVPGRGPDQLNRCEVAAESSLLTRSHLCSHISRYNTTGVYCHVAAPESRSGKIAIYMPQDAGDTLVKPKGPTG